MEHTALEADGRRTAPAATLLDRALDLGTVTWGTIAAVGAVAVALTLRLPGLDVWAMAPEEARRSFDAWLLYRGQPAPAGEALSETTPLFLLAQSLTFFLFGTSDVTARLAPALLGLVLVALALALRPFVGKPAALGMAALAAFSPTLVFASRSATPEIAVACIALLLLVALLRGGAAKMSDAGARSWAATAGIALAALIGSGPSAITVLISLGVGVGVAIVTEGDGPLRRGLGALVRVPGAAASAAVAFVATAVVLFTRFFSDLAAIVGVGALVADWGRLLAETSVDTPTQFFMLAALLYEPLAVLLAVVAALRGRRGRGEGLGWAVFGAWFVTALLLWSFSAGRAPEHAVHVALPLVLLGGGVLGDLVAAVDRRDALRGRGGLLALAYLGLLVAVAAVAILLGRVDTSLDPRAAAVQATVVAMLAVVPLAYAVFHLIGSERAAGRHRQPALLALLVPGLLLAGFTLRSSILLNFYRAGDGTELLAQRTPTAAIRPEVERLERLSRDVTLLEGSVRDTPGGRGLSIAAGRDVRWPFQWYFRDFPDFTTVDGGQEALAGTQVVIAADDPGLAEAGYTPREVPWLNRVPPAYAAPEAGPILGALVRPDRWLEGVRFLLFREGPAAAAVQTVALGLDAELAARVFPTTGPYALGDRPGAGAGRGQFNQPIGIAVGSAGTTYVVDQGNARVQRFAADGEFLGIWGEEEGGLDFARTESGLGPTGIAVGPDDLVYVADTWNHRVVVVGPDGEEIREIGAAGDVGDGRRESDIGDDAALVESAPGEFFGPRAVAVTDQEVYVVDTGNERVQVFGIDGTFRRLWGGYGSEPNRLIEPVGIALGPDGLVYVADSGNARISVFTPDGTPVTQWPVAAWPEPDPGGVRPGFQPYLAFDEAGRLYATSAESGSVEVFDGGGTRLEAIDAAGGNPLQQPVGVAVAPDGALLIGDIGRDAVVREEREATPPLAQIVIAQPPVDETVSVAGAAAPTSAPLPGPPR